MVDQQRLYLEINNTEVAECICTFYHNGKANVMLIDSFEVRKHWRNRGYGSMLIKMAVDLAREKKVDSVELTVNKDNLIAKHLYEKFLFNKTKKDYYRLIL
jgi:GNAT superfamily N-acetyltransferase